MTGWQLLIAAAFAAIPPTLVAVASLITARSAAAIAHAAALQQQVDSQTGKAPK